MGFRRIATILIAVSLLTAAVISIYFWRKINAPKNLATLVPADVSTFYQFKTREIRDLAKGNKPEYIDSVAHYVAGFPIFSKIKDPADVGIDLYSDIIFFRRESDIYLALSVTSEGRLTGFIKEKVPKNLINEIVVSKNCNFVSAKNNQLFFAWKGKTCVILAPFEELPDATKALGKLNALFDPNVKNSISQNEVVKQFNNHNAQIIFYQSGDEVKNSFGVNISGAVTEFIYPSINQDNSKFSPLELFLNSGLKLSPEEKNACYKMGNKMPSNTYINLTFRTLNSLFKPYSNDKK